MERKRFFTLGLAAYLSATAAGLAQPPERVREGLVALYTFASADRGVPDVSGVTDPVPLIAHGNLAGPARKGAGLTLDGPRSVLRSEDPAAKINEALSESGQMTLEVWLKPTSLDQTGPARIVSLSAGTALDARNFTLGQAGRRYAFRLRTSTPVAANGFRVTERLAPEDVVLPERHQVVVTYAACPYCRAGTLRLYVNGRLIIQWQDLRGDFSAWDPDFDLLVGNESTLDRQWRGTVSLVAMYRRALTAKEIAANFAAGVGPAK